MSEELNNNELSTSMVEPGESVIAEVEPIIETEPVVEEPEMNRALHGSTMESVLESTEENTITTPQYASVAEEVQSLGPVGDGAIGATTAPRLPKKSTGAKASKKKETVALHSTKNVTWNGVGKVYRGYNIVDQETANKWLTRDHIRIATPEEVAREFGK